MSELVIPRPTVVRTDDAKRKKKKMKPKIKSLKGFIQLSLHDFFKYDNQQLRKVATTKHCNELFSTNQCPHTKRKILVCKIPPMHLSIHIALCEVCKVNHEHNIQIGIGKVYRAIKNFPLSIADVTRIVELPATNVRTYIRTLDQKGIILTYQNRDDMRKRQVELNPLWISN
ncbi:hypothetical protein LCGC14_0303520 [marine sediment metagenome]|uniref:Uncharacterized protein n=1 Tax=marine sediment metagenome TaxID=412755 RepID=A0A0F9WBC7_9ZZZZ